MRQEDHVKSVASLSAPLLEVLRKRWQNFYKKMGTICLKCREVQ